MDTGSRYFMHITIPTTTFGKIFINVWASFDRTILSRKDYEMNDIAPLSIDDAFQLPNHIHRSMASFASMSFSQLAFQIPRRSACPPFWYGTPCYSPSQRYFGTQWLYALNIFSVPVPLEGILPPTYRITLQGWGVWTQDGNWNIFS